MVPAGSQVHKYSNSSINVSLDNREAEHVFFSPQLLPEEAEFAHTGLQWQGPLLSALHLAELCYHPVDCQE